MSLFRIFAGACFMFAATAASAQHPLDAELPRGWGSSTTGLFTFKHQCSRCHSEYDTFEAAANTGTCFVDPKWMFNYIKQTMPPGASGSLKDSDVYGLVAYILTMKGIIKRGDFMNAANLAKVPLPNNGAISAGCPVLAGGLGKGNDLKPGAPKTVPLPGAKQPPPAAAPAKKKQ